MPKCPNFKIQEFACKDGTDEILLDDLLVQKLQAMRNHFNVPININSGYRTKKHNASVGGASNSYHTKGMAADIYFGGKVSLLEAAKIAELLSFGGIGLYGSYIHVDTRSTNYYYDQRSGSAKTVKTFLTGGETLNKQKTDFEIVQDAFGFDANTMLYLGFYKFGTELLKKLADKVR